MAVQDRLRIFYIGAYIHLGFEACAALIWIAQMFAFKFGPDMTRIVGGEYRLTNTLMLFHLGTPLAMLGAVQQAQNRNSVLWWTFFAFLVSLFGDLETIMEIGIENLSKQVPWAWRFACALASINLILTSFAIIWFAIWYKKLPRPAGMPKQYQKF